MKSLQISTIFLATLLATGCAKSQETEEQTPDPTTTQESSEAVSARMEGKMFVVDVLEEGKSESTIDTLTYVDGQFHSADCVKYGFGSADYTESSEGESTLFSATTLSAEEGQMAWSGTVTGDQIDGDATWTKEGQDAILYHYSGNLQEMSDSASE